MKKVKLFFNNFVNDLRTIPSILLALFCVAIVLMNVLANKTIFQNQWLAIDGGIIITWLVVVIMDLVTAVCGPRVSIKMSIFGTIVSLFASLLFFIVSKIPGGPEFNAFTEVLGGTWFIIVAGAISFIISSSINALINHSIGKKFKKDPTGKKAFSVRSCVSTFVSQVFDNFTFNLLAYALFAPIFWNGFHWTVLQCFTCAIVYGLLELLIEFVLFPIIYRIYKSWLARKELQESK